MYEAAASLISASTNNPVSKTALPVVLANALHKPCPADAAQASACIELKGMIAMLGTHYDAETEADRKAALLDIARFVEEARSRSAPQDSSWLRLPKAAHDILAQEGATDRSHLIDSSPRAAYDDIMAEYERAAITNHLEAMARNAGNMVRPSLVSQCRRLFPADNPQTLNFINQIISAARLGDWEASILRTPPPTETQPQVLTIDPTTGLPTPASVGIRLPGNFVIDPSTGLPIPADYVAPLPWEKEGKAGLRHATDLITDPLAIQFSSWFMELYHNSRNVSGTIILDSGAPVEMTVVVKGLSNGVVWQPFSTNFTCILGEKDGAYEIRVGLRGMGKYREPVWFPMDEFLDRVPPVVVITSPISGVTSQPVVQLLGYSSKETGHERLHPGQF